MSQTNNPELNNNSSSIMSDIQPNLQQLVEELQSIRATWKLFGLHLGIPNDDLEAIDVDKTNVGDKLYVLCYKWLQMKPRGTWNDIVKALKKIERLDLAESLEKKYIKHHRSMPPKVAVEPPPLMRAACTGNVYALRALLQSNIDPDEAIDGATALYMASQNGHYQCVDLLLQSKANLDVQTNEGRTALYIASQTGHHQCVDLLLHSKANPDIQSNEGATALCIASQNGHDQCVDLLLHSKANLDVQTNEGLTALFIASQHGHDQCVDLLLHSKANPDVQTNNGFTALYAASQNGHHQCVDLLLQSKANPNILTKNGVAPLTAAVFSKYHHIASMLLEHNADPNSCVYNPLFVACDKGHLSLVSLLLQYGALVNIPGKISPLTMAVKRGHYDIAKSLINAGANVNIQEQYATPCGITPLMTASTYGNLPMVQLLLQSGADVMIQDKEGYTAYDAAKGHQHQKILTLLTIKLFEQAQKHLLQSEESHDSASPQQHQDNDERQTEESSLETIRNHFNSIMFD